MILFSLALLSEKMVNENIERLITSIQYNFRIEPSELPKTVAKIKQLYIGEETDANKVAEGLINVSKSFQHY